MKEDIRNLTIEEFWQKYSKDYDYVVEEYENEYFDGYCKSVLLYIGDFYEDGIDRDMLMHSDYQHFDFSRNEYFDEDEDYVGYNYSVCARNEGSPVEYQPDTKMSDVFGAIYDEVRGVYSELLQSIKSEIDEISDDDEIYNKSVMLERKWRPLQIDFIELYADRLGIEYYYDDCWRMHITKIEKVWI